MDDFDENSEREDRAYVTRFILLTLRPHITKWEGSWLASNVDRVYKTFVRGRLSTLRFEACAIVHHRIRMNRIAEIKNDWEGEL